MRPIIFHQQTKEEWLKDIPELIKLLSNEYNFYWSKLYHHIASQDIKTFLEKKKDNYNHKMCVYVVKDSVYFFVVFCKNKIDVYYLKDNYLDTEGKVYYFMKKWKAYYEKEYEDTSFNEEEVNTLW